MKNNRLGENLSVYLDLLRLVAALAVFVNHANSVYFHLEHTFFLSQGRQAVAVFFVLSGFVISFVVAEKERDWKQYIRARVSRLYSVTIVAVIVTLVADTIGFHLDETLYKALPFYQPPALATVITYLTFTNQVWFSHAVLGTNEPFWSLGFEAPYYILFGFLSYIPDRKVVLLMILIWLACFGPSIALYFPLWFLGHLVYRAIRLNEPAFNQRIAWIAFGSSIIFFLLVDRMGRRLAGNMYHLFAFPQEGFVFLWFFLFGLAVAVNLLSFRRLAEGRIVFNAKSAAIIKWLAGASFTLYLTHQPLLILFACLLPKTQTSRTVGVLTSFLVLLIVLVIAEIGERRKAFFARAVRSIF